MANTTVATGHGGSLTFATSALAFNWMTITPGDSTVPDIDVSHLATPTNRQYIPGDLIEDGSVTVEFQFDSAGQEIPLKVVEVVTVTWPQSTGETAPATLSGTAYINSRTPSALATDELQTGTMTFKWDGGANGGTAPTFTPATTA